MGLIRHKHIRPANLGFTLGQLDQATLDIIKKEVDKIQDDFSKAKIYNENLVGNIKHEYILEDSCDAIFETVVELIEKNQTEFRWKNFFDSPINGNYRRSNFWVNFMKKGEFNPIHKHIGTWSFVIWYKIPYTMDEERAMIANRIPESAKKSGIFEFVYSSVLGAITTEILEVDKFYEGTICVFPADLNHTVYPFYSSDDYRISISGNVTFD